MRAAHQVQSVGVCVSGCSGFIGKRASKMLVSSQVRVVPITRSVLASGLHDTGAMAAALAGCDAVLHLAARAHVLIETSATPLAEYRAINRDATLALANAASHAGARRFVFVSSIFVNGASNSRPFRPGDPPAPKGPYAISKYEAELGLREIAAKSGLQVVIVRPPLVYGQEVKGNFLRLLKLSASGIPLPLGSVSGVRSLISIWNLCDLLIRCLEHPAAAGRTFLASDGEDIALPHLIHALAGGMGRPCRLFPVPLAVLRAGAKMLGKRATFDKLTESLQVDISETKRVLEWEPPLSLRAGLARTAQWYAQETLRKGTTQT